MKLNRVFLSIIFLQCAVIAGLMICPLLLGLKLMLSQSVIDNILGLYSVSLNGKLVIISPIVIGILTVSTINIILYIQLRRVETYLIQISKDNYVNIKGNERLWLGGIFKLIQKVSDKISVSNEMLVQINKGEDIHNLSAKLDGILKENLLLLKYQFQGNETKLKEYKHRNEAVGALVELLNAEMSEDELSESILPFIVKEMNAVQGIFYKVKSDPIILIETKSVFAYNRIKRITKSFNPKDGIVGQAYYEQCTIQLTEIPEDYLIISSGILGDAKPNALLLVPIIFNNEVLGLLELAGMRKFSIVEVELVRELSEIIGNTLFNILMKRQTKLHLKEVEQMRDALLQQKEALLKKNVEMEAVQDKMEATNKELEQQIKQVSNFQKKIATLLANSNEVIFIYDKEKRIRYSSPSAGRILGYEDEYLINKADEQFIHDKDKIIYRSLFIELFKNPGKEITKQYRFQKKEW